LAALRGVKYILDLGNKLHKPWAANSHKTRHPEGNMLIITRKWDSNSSDRKRLNTKRERYREGTEVYLKKHKKPDTCRMVLRQG